VSIYPDFNGIINDNDMIVAKTNKINRVLCNQRVVVVY
jgi:hypothetical protein